MNINIPPPIHSGTEINIPPINSTLGNLSSIDSLSTSNIQGSINQNHNLSNPINSNESDSIIPRLSSNVIAALPMISSFIPNLNQDQSNNPLINLHIPPAILPVNLNSETTDLAMKISVPNHIVNTKPELTLHDIKPSTFEYGSSDSKTSIQHKLIEKYPIFRQQTKFFSSPPITIDTSIQNTINNADNNSKIIVPNNHYSESISIDKNIQIEADKDVVFKPGRKDYILKISKIARFNGITFDQNKIKLKSMIIIDGSEVVFENCNFLSNSFAVIVKSDASVYFNNCHFSCSEGSAIFASCDSYISVIDCSFDSPLSTSIVLKDKSVLTASGCTFTKTNKASISLLDHSQAVISFCKFNETWRAFDLATDGKYLAIIHSEISGSEVGIKIVKALSPDITNCTFTQISKSCIECIGDISLNSSHNQFCSSEKSMLLCADSSKVISDGDKFEGSSKAAIAVIGGSTLNLKNASITKVDGCGIYTADKSSIKISKVTINEVSKSALNINTGELIAEELRVQNCPEVGIYINRASKLSIISSKIENCSASGLIIENIDANAAIIDTSLINSSVYSKDSDVTFSDIRFTNSHAEFHNSRLNITSADSSESLFIAKNCQTNIISGKFFKSQKTCFYAISGSLSVRGSKFEENDGHCIYAVGQSNITIEGSTFKNNTSPSIVASGFETFVSLLEDDFNSNSLAAIAINKAELKISKTKFTENTVACESCDGGKIVCDQCIFEKTVGDAALYCHDGGKIELLETVIQGGLHSGVVASGELLVKASKILQNGCTGIAFVGRNAVGVVVQSLIQENEKCGIIIEAGDIQISHCNISRNALIGIKIANDATPKIQDNEIQQNGRVNVERE